MRNIVAASILAAILNVLAWWLSHEAISPPALEGVIESVSVNLQPPKEEGRETEEKLLAQFDRKLGEIAKVASAIRLYASHGLHARLPAVVEKKGLRVILGAWLQGNPKWDEHQVTSVIEQAKRGGAVRSIIVGNETILRKALSEEELIKRLRQVREGVRVPVSTGETWDIWLAHPKLVNEVDFIAAHILPYWEGIPADKAIEYTFKRYDELRKAYPGKRVMIAEFGWPSRGYNNKGAVPDPLTQAKIVREFIAETQRRGVPFNLIEAFDQPWKTDEGSVGPYWGLFNADGQPKFSLTGVVEEQGLTQIAALAVAIGAVVSLFGLISRHPTFLHALAFAVAANALSAAIAVAAFYPVENYLNVGSAIAWFTGFMLMIPLTAMTLVKVHEVTEITLGHRPKRLLRPDGGGPDPASLPKVCVQIPACREEPDMLKETLDAVAALDYPDYEVLVVLNNTPDERHWRPIEEHCNKLGPRFKFLNLEHVAGFKAGALTAAMTHMAPDAGIIALIDADYVVGKNWLKDLVPVFADPKVALVQAPQDHRDGHQSVFKAIMNSEYAGFFNIGMVQRNEDDAIIAHGTMLLLRRSAFEEVGAWQTDTITEDTELGLRLFEAGHAAHYTDHRYGFGVLPDTYKAFKTQRQRWAYGAVQIFRKHWRHMLPGAPTLTPAQKFQFVSGWAHWLSDAFGVVAAIFNLFWVPMILFVGVLIPALPFTFPILVAFVVNLFHCFLLYGTRVKIPPGQIAGAALAAMSLQWTVASAVAAGLLKDNLPFLRTDKGGAAKGKAATYPARTETCMGVLLAASALILHLTNKTEVTEITVFAATLAVQSLPFLSAVAMYALERLSASRQASA